MGQAQVWPAAVPAPGSASPSSCGREQAPLTRAWPHFSSSPQRGVALLLLHGSPGLKTRLTGRGSALSGYRAVCISYSTFCPNGWSSLIEWPWMSLVFPTSLSKVRVIEGLGTDLIWPIALTSPPPLGTPSFCSTAPCRGSLGEAPGNPSGPGTGSELRSGVMSSGHVAHDRGSSAMVAPFLLRAAVGQAVSSAVETTTRRTDKHPDLLGVSVLVQRWQRER